MKVDIWAEVTCPRCGLAWDDSHPVILADHAGEAPVCGPDGCALPERA